MKGYTEITKADFYSNGGFNNPKLVRVTRGKQWVYYSRYND